MDYIIIGGKSHSLRPVKSRDLEFFDDDDDTPILQSKNHLDEDEDEDLDDEPILLSETSKMSNPDTKEVIRTMPEKTCKSGKQLVFKENYEIQHNPLKLKEISNFLLELVEESLNASDSEKAAKLIDYVNETLKIHLDLKHLIKTTR